MNQVDVQVGLNSPPKKLEKPVVIEGKKVDPLSGGLINTDSQFIVRPVDEPGISFRVNDIVIPYDRNHLGAIDSTLGRMLRLKNDDKKIQIVLVEHLLSAINLLGLTNIEIALDRSSFGPLTSSNFPIFGLKKETYWIPVMGPGVSGFVDALSPQCVPLNQTPETINIQSERVHKLIDPNPRYKGIERSISIEPADRLIIQVLSAQQPDIINNPEATPVVIEQGQDVSNLLHARPIMRLRNKFEEAVLFVLNLRSFALTRETYFRSRSSMSTEQVVGRMFPEFQVSQNEHLYHTALADFPAELGAFLRGRHLHAKLTLTDTNHVFRMEGLRHLLTPEVLGE